MGTKRDYSFETPLEEDLLGRQVQPRFQLDRNSLRGFDPGADFFDDPEKLTSSSAKRPRRRVGKDNHWHHAR